MVHPITNHRNEFTLTEWNYQVVYALSNSEVFMVYKSKAEEKWYYITTS